MAHVSQDAIRSTLSQLSPGGAHKASTPPPPEDIYAPESHRNALDPERTLIVGNRGVGKSFWSSVLASDNARKHITAYYPKLELDRVKVALGFHEAAGKTSDASPSPRVLGALVEEGHEPEEIWRAVLFRSLRAHIGSTSEEELGETISKMQSNVEKFDASLRSFDAQVAGQGRLFLLLFDALDRLGPDWSSIRKLTVGLLRLALDVRGFKAIRIKIFMRSDQANDDSIFRFADASKLRAEKVDLTWRRRDLYGLLFQRLWNDAHSRPAFKDLVAANKISVLPKGAFPTQLKNDENLQAAVFHALAGEFMGVDRRRGRTYSWLHDHLADAFGETSPRSFLIALQRAATHEPRPSLMAIDYQGIRYGVQEASDVRLSELKEDYSWIVDAINALEGLEVPCPPEMFVERWKDRKTIRKMQLQLTSNRELGPVELEDGTKRAEAALLLALKNIGVIEFRAEDRINVPDIFRVAAKIKRRGGVRPPTPAGRR